MVVKTEYIERDIPIIPLPPALALKDVRWYVITETNFDVAIEKFIESNGAPWVLYSMGSNSYENLSLNMGDIIKYIKNLRSIIDYYEQLSTDKNNEESTNESE